MDTVHAVLISCQNEVMLGYVTGHYIIIKNTYFVLMIT